jgi:hypothetical protein
MSHIYSRSLSRVAFAVIRPSGGHLLVLMESAVHDGR